MTENQMRLCEKKFQFAYPDYQIDYVKGDTQRIETSRGCLRDCPFCYESTRLKVFDIPDIIKKKVQIIDMNFLWQPNIIDRIRSLPKAYYEEVSGFDFRLMKQEIANELKKARFVKIRIAWDWYVKDQYKIKDVIGMFLKAGFTPADISCFMLVNWKVPYDECCRKLDLLKVWNVKVCDCCFDGGYPTVRHNSSSPIIPFPIYWSIAQIKDFRNKCRKHNQLVRFKIDPEVK